MRAKAHIPTWIWRCQRNNTWRSPWSTGDDLTTDYMGSALDAGPLLCLGLSRFFDDLVILILGSEHQLFHIYSVINPVLHWRRFLFLAPRLLIGLDGGIPSGSRFRSSQIVECGKSVVVLGLEGVFVHHAYAICLDVSGCP